MESNIDIEEVYLPDQQRRESSPVLPSPPSSQSNVPRVLSRKRPFGASRKATDEDQLAAAFNTSSDPAFFSSDETPDLENYSGSKRRKKKVYSGTWWGGRLRPSTSRQNIRSNNEKEDRQFRRNFDSGIFMAEDTSASELSSDSLIDELHAAEAVSAGFFSKVTGRSVGDPLPMPDESLSSRSKFKRWRSDQLPSDELSLLDQAVTDRVEKCLEQGCEDVDLAGLSLTALPASITQLTALVRQTPLTGQFRDLSLRPRVYLGNNNFSLFPGQLLNVPTVELLSLRQNQLSELPDQIIKMTSLARLNVSGNQLEYLPFNVLHMRYNSQLHEIQSEPNPWRKAPPREEQLADFPRVVHNTDRFYMRRVAVSPATGTTANGQGTTLRTSEDARLAQPKSPNLGEFILRSLAKSNLPHIDLSTAEEIADCPDNVKGMLHALYRSQHTGGHQCTFCGRSMILPRQQWIEWWSVHSRPSEQQKSRLFSIETEVEAEENKEEGEHVQTLPYVRRTCGCRLQVEGLMEEKHLYEQLIAAGVPEENAISPRKYEWPQLWTR